MSRNDAPTTPGPNRAARRWLWIGILTAGVLATCVLGFLGFRAHLAAQPEIPDADPAFLDLVYLTLQLFTLESGAVTTPPWTLQIARYLAPVVVGYTVVLAAVGLGFRQYQIWRARMQRGHVVICGLGLTGYTFARRFRDAGERVVAIELDEENDLAQACRTAGIAVINGNAADPDILLRAGVAHAGTLIATCGDESLNAAISLKARDLSTRQKHDPMCCHVHVTDPELLTFLREDAWRPEDPARPTLEFFNLFDLGAEHLLETREATAIGHDGKPGGILLAGFGFMGRNILIRLARQWWSQEGPQRHGLLPVVIVDVEAGRLIRQVQTHFPAMAKTCNLVPLECDVRAIDFEDESFRKQLPAGMALSASLFIALGDDTLSLSSALRMHRGLRSKHQQDVTTTVLLTRLGGLSSLLTGTESSAGVRMFGLLESACTPQALRDASLVERLARALHRSYVRKQLAGGKAMGSKPALVPWEELGDRYRNSNRDQARWAPLRLHQMGCGIRPRTDWSTNVFQFEKQELATLGALEHQRWVDFNESIQVRYGNVRDEKKRLHHCMVAWEQLTKEEQSWDIQFFLDLPGILADLGYDIYRRTETPPSEGQEATA